MTRRSTARQNFVDAAREAFDQFAQDPSARGSIGGIFRALEELRGAKAGAGARLQVEHLDRAKPLFAFCG